MKPASLAALLFLLAACASTSSLESQFAREKGALACFEGPTSEPSCSGTGLTVYLQADKVRHLDWTIETSQQIIHREYYFEGAAPVQVVETIHTKVTSRGDLLEKPRRESVQVLVLNTSPPIPRRKELLDHAHFLIADFRSHRKDFTRTTSGGGQ